jgi:hypothetical protein
MESRLMEGRLNDLINEAVEQSEGAQVVDKHSSVYYNPIT